MSEDPRATLRRVAKWIAIFGYILLAAGAAVVIQSILSSDEQFWRILRGGSGFVGWIIPGAGYLLCAFYLPRRRRWAITGAEIFTYIQLSFAGILLIISLLHVRGMWPMIVIAIVWIVPLLLVPKLTSQCSPAMDFIATHPELGLIEKPRRESRRAK
jgi:hypothetical protein